MRTLIVSHAAIRSSNRRMYRELANRDGEVTLLVPDRWKSGLGPLLAEPEPEHSRLRVVVRKRVGISHSNVYCLSGFDEIVRRVHPDAIYIDEDPAGLVAAQGARSAARHRAGLVVLAIQNLLKRYPVPFETLQRYVFTRTRTAVCTSEQAAQTLVRRGFQGRLLPLPFSTDLVPLDAERKAAIRASFTLQGPLAGFSGRLVREKGVDTFLRALATTPEINAAIIGDGPERAALERLAEQLGVLERVRFLGAHEPAQATLLLGALDVLVLPSRTMPNWAEQFGRVLIEAMASGVAVVASDSGAIGEVVADAGLLVPEDDPDELARALREAFATRASLADRGLKRAREHYTSSVEADALHAALAAAAQSR